MASINPYAEEKEHVLFVYDAPIAFQIHFCFTITAQLASRQLVNLPQPPHLLTIQFVTPSTHQLTNTPYCPLFGINFNIMSTLAGHQSLTLPQKIDSRGGSF